MKRNKDVKDEWLGLPEGSFALHANQGGLEERKWKRKDIRRTHHLHLQMTIHIKLRWSHLLLLEARFWRMSERKTFVIQGKGDGVAGGRNIRIVTLERGVDLG
jgi:hypothetical protein